jgi:hypothetical protein
LQLLPAVRAPLLLKTFCLYCSFIVGAQGIHPPPWLNVCTYIIPCNTYLCQVYQYVIGYLGQGEIGLWAVLEIDKHRGGGLTIDYGAVGGGRMILR